MKKIKKKLSVFSIVLFMFSTYFILSYNGNTFSLGNKVYAATVSKTVKVTSVSVNKTKGTLTVGGKDTLVAKVAPSNATNKGVTWSTSNGKVATVSNGVVTAVGKGTATITVTTVDGKKTAKYIVTVNPLVKVTSVNLNKAKNTITVGGKDTLVATVAPSNATNKGVTWSTSNGKVATVSNGVVTAVGKGTATITVATVDGKKTAKYIVTVNQIVRVTSVKLNKTKNTLTIGGKDTLIATVAPSNATNKGVTWSTSNGKVATVSNGVVTAVGKGTATITVTTVDSKKTASYSITVNPVVQASPAVKVTSIALNKAADNLTLGEWDNLYAYEFLSSSNSPYQPITWKSSNSKVATVSSIGQVVTVGPGTAVISATAGGKTANCTVNVKSPIAVKSISINKTTLNLSLGSIDNLYANVLPFEANGSGVIWKTSNSKVATVSYNGVVTTVGLGKATITATTQDGSKSASCSINVTPTVKVRSIALNTNTSTLTVGDISYLYATIAPRAAVNKNVTWKTSNSKVAVVDSNGNVTAIGAGTATITATTVDGGKTSSCIVTVSSATSSSVNNISSISLNKTVDTLGVGGTDYLSPTVYPYTQFGGQYQTLAWTTSNPKVVMVNSNGNITAVGAGKAIITVTSDDGSKSASCTVTVTPAVKVTSVVLNKTTDTLTVGSSDNIWSTIYPYNATNQQTTWTTSNTNVVNINSYGYINAVGLGTATITVTTVDGSKTAKCIVTVTSPVKVTGVQFDIPPTTLAVGNTTSIHTSVYPYNAANTSLTWSTSNSKVATVDNYGYVTAVSAGTVNITATTVDGNKKATCTMTVTSPVKVTGIGLYTTSTSLTVGDTSYLNSIIYPTNATNRNVTYTTSNSKVVTVDSNGNVRAISAGKATITVTTVDGKKTAICNVVVNNPVKVTSVALNKITDTLVVGNSDYLNTIVYPYNASNKNIMWTTSNSKVATVSIGGTVTAVSAGKATITAITEDGNKIAICIATVNPPVKVTSVVVNKTTDILTVGGNDDLWSTIYPYNATNQNVAWTTSNAKVATVSYSGYVTAVAAGTVTITATTEDGSKTAKCTVTVNNPVKVTSVTLNKTTANLNIGGYDSLYATVSPNNAENKSVTWTTSNSKVATVDYWGGVSAVSAGKATITAITADGNKTATCTVTVNPPVKVTGIGLYTTSTNLTVGDNSGLSYTVYPYNAANQNVTWTSSNTKVATVDSSGYIKAISAGKVIITVTTEDGKKTAVCNVTVSTPVKVSSISLSRTTDTLVVGNNDYLNSIIYPYNAANKNVIWTTSNSKVATVSTDGNVTAVSAGTATITVTTEDGSKTATCKVTVNSPVAVTSVALSKTTSTLSIGGTDYISATVSPRNAANQAVVWTTSDSKVVVISNNYDSNINIKGVGAGIATITVTTEDGSKTATCKVTVNAPVAVTSVGLNKIKDTLTVGGTDNLSPTIYPYNAANQNVAWTSSNSSVAAVDSDGDVTAIAVGTAVITATTDDGRKTAICTVTVNPPVSVTSVGLDKATFTLSEGQSDYIYPKIYPDNAANKAIVWTTSDSTVASVSNYYGDGYVTAVGAGKATITATTVDGSKVATCTVTVKPIIKVTSVALNKNTSTLSVGRTDYLYATVAPNDAADQSVIWTTSDSSVATVNYYGNVTAVGVGTATITATTDDGGKKATCVVTVVN